MKRRTLALNDVSSISGGEFVFRSDIRDSGKKASRPNPEEIIKEKHPAIPRKADWENRANTLLRKTFVAFLSVLSRTF